MQKAEISPYLLLAPHLVSEGAGMARMDISDSYNTPDVGNNCPEPIFASSGVSVMRSDAFRHLTILTWRIGGHKQVLRKDDILVVTAG